MSMDCSIKTDTNWFRYRACAIIIEDGCVLFAHNEKDTYYYSIGGGVKMGETAEKAVLREVFEETGVHYEIDRLAFVHENFFDGTGTLLGKQCHELAFYFLMKPRGSQQLNSNSYTQGVREYMAWLPVDRLAEYEMYPLFFAEKLPNMPPQLEHIVTHENRL